MKSDSCRTSVRVQPTLRDGAPDDESDSSGDRASASFFFLGYVVHLIRVRGLTITCYVVFNEKVNNLSSVLQTQLHEATEGSVSRSAMVYNTMSTTESSSVHDISYLNQYA